MCNKTGVKCVMPVKGQLVPGEPIERRIARAADLATQTFGSP
jgi:hypothetical protein